MRVLRLQIWTTVTGLFVWFVDSYEEYINKNNFIFSQKPTSTTEMNNFIYLKIIKLTLKMNQ